MYKKVFSLILSAFMLGVSFIHTSAWKTDLKSAGFGKALCKTNWVVVVGFVEGPEGSEFSYIVKLNTEEVFKDYGKLPNWEHIQYSNWFPLKPGENFISIEWSITSPEGTEFSESLAYKCINPVPTTPIPTPTPIKQKLDKAKLISVENYDIEQNGTIEIAFKGNLEKIHACKVDGGCVWLEAPNRSEWLRTSGKIEANLPIGFQLEPGTWVLQGFGPDGTIGTGQKVDVHASWR